MALNVEKIAQFPLLPLAEEVSCTNKTSALCINEKFSVKPMDFPD
jgi:hypothetical protein